MNVRPATIDDCGAYFDHSIRHFRESGTGTDLIFHPVEDFETYIKEEHVAKMVEGLGKPLTEMGWLRAWIAEEGGEVLGDVLLRSSYFAPSLHRCQLSIGVERAARGQGLGGRLTMQAVSWARMQPELSWIDLFVFAHNAPAIALYEKAGFEHLNVVKDQFRVRGTRIDDIHMTLRLR